jgi:outer membrane lipoprotein-sorting protein
MAAWSQPSYKINFKYLKVVRCPMRYGHCDFLCKRDSAKMARRFCFVILGILLLGLLLSGCAKRMVRLPPVEGPPVENPMAKLLEAFSATESLHAKASIRIETVRRGEEIKFLLNGALLYQKPDKFRMMGYHPMGIGLFDALYQNGEFFILIPSERRAYTGRTSELDGLAEKVGGIQISSEKDHAEVPTRIRIEIREKETRVDLRLKESVANASLPEDAFAWKIPEGVELRPLPQLLKGKKEN